MSGQWVAAASLEEASCSPCSHRMVTDVDQRAPLARATPALIDPEVLLEDSRALKVVAVVLSTNGRKVLMAMMVMMMVMAPMRIGRRSDKGHKQQDQ
jgi:hypothetical protein